MGGAARVGGNGVVKGNEDTSGGRMPGKAAGSPCCCCC